MASYLDIQVFADLVRAKRGERGLRDTAQEIGTVSPSTISRVEREQLPDLQTFLALCDWLEIAPTEFIKNTDNKRKKDDYKDDYEAICLQLRSDRRLEPGVGQAIATLIEFALKASD